MGYIQLAVLVLQIFVKIFDAAKEKNAEIKKAKTEALQSGVRGIIDKDVSRVTSAFDDFNNARM